MQRRKHLCRIRILSWIVVLCMMIGGTMPALALDETSAAQISAASVLAEQDLPGNAASIRILIEQCANALAEDDPAKAVLDTVLVLLDSGTASGESIALLLRSAIDSQAEAAEPTAAPGGGFPFPSQPEAPVTDVPAPDTASDGGGMVFGSPDQGSSMFSDHYAGQPGLPAYETKAFIKTVLQDAVLMDVPQDWGNNASDMALTSYSPVNASGAISPSAGTLTISYFPAEGSTEEEAFDTYTNNIAAMSVTTSLDYTDLTTASLPARQIEFTMSVGANQFSCETVCFAHDNTIYAIELMQGQQTEYDYFPVYYHVLDSAEVGDSERIEQALSQSESPSETPADTPPAAPTEAPAEVPASVPTEAPAEIPEAVPTEVPSEVPADSPETVPAEAISFSGDISSFQYAVNGHVYSFPTSVRDLQEGDLPLDRQLTIPYDFSSDADMRGGKWTEIVNTQYYYFENSLHKEMAGITNMSGYPVGALDCMLTALIDTEGSYVDIVLPGNVRVGGQESDILLGFPAFAGMPLDGIASFQGNELLYACNVRDDGCNGYVLIRNDAPYYSAVSIICENGTIREISFECLGSVRADGVFL